MLRAIRIYLSLILLGNLIWEALQLPLYTIWQTGTPRQQAFAVVHCTGGDFLIATTALILALIAVGHRDWPMLHFKRVAAVAIALGLGYAVFSEWLNVSVRGSWSYSTLMPVLSLAGWKVGLSPLLQWSIVPTLCFVVVRFFRQPPQTKGQS